MITGSSLLVGFHFQGKLVRRRELGGLHRAKCKGTVLLLLCWRIISCRRIVAIRSRGHCCMDDDVVSIGKPKQHVPLFEGTHKEIRFRFQCHQRSQDRVAGIIVVVIFGVQEQGSPCRLILAVRCVLLADKTQSPLWRSAILGSQIHLQRLVPPVLLSHRSTATPRRWFFERNNKEKKRTLYSARLLLRLLLQRTMTTTHHLLPYYDLRAGSDPGRWCPAGILPSGPPRRGIRGHSTLVVVGSIHGSPAAVSESRRRGRILASRPRQQQQACCWFLLCARRLASFPKHNELPYVQYVGALLLVFYSKYIVRHPSSSPSRVRAASFF